LRLPPLYSSNFANLQFVQFLIAISLSSIKFNARLTSGPGGIGLPGSSFFPCGLGPVKFKGLSLLNSKKIAARNNNQPC
jgi:hypothetical protein